MDHLKKLVYIIVGCLTIISLVFTLCHKVGHCASSENNPIPFGDSYPLLTGGGIGSSGYYSDSYILSCVDDAITRFTDYNNDFVAVFYVDTSYLAVAIKPNYLPTIPSNFGDNISFSFRSVYYYTPTTFDHVSNWQILQVQPNRVTETINGNTYYITGVDASNYPLYVYNYESFYFANTSTQVFSRFTSSEPDNPSIGHTKGGVLANYIDSDDLIEQDSSLPTVDTNPPSDTTSNSAWYQKILNGIGKINQSLKGGVLTIGDYLGQIKESLENAIAWITEPPDSDTIMDNVEPYLAQNDLISGFLSSKSAIQGVYSSIGNVSAKTRSQMVWDIPFNLPSMSQTFHAVIDFGWYENIRSTFEPFLNMFLCIGFLFSFIRSIPGILHGNSGEGDT